MAANLTVMGGGIAEDGEEDEEEVVNTTPLQDWQLTADEVEFVVDVRQEEDGELSWVGGREGGREDTESRIDIMVPQLFSSSLSRS